MYIFDSIINDCVDLHTLCYARQIISELAEQLRLTLGLDAVYLADGMQSSRMGPGMQPAVLRAVEDMQLSQGDALVVSSGMAVYGVAHMELPPLDGVALAPAVGGVAVKRAALIASGA